MWNRWRAKNGKKTGKGKKKKKKPTKSRIKIELKYGDRK